MSRYKLQIEFHEVIDGEPVVHRVKVPQPYDTLGDLSEGLFDFVLAYSPNLGEIKLNIEVIDDV